MKSFKIFGRTIQLGKKVGTNAANGEMKKNRATRTIKRQPKREVSFQIADIKSAIQLAEDVQQPNRTKLHDIYRYILRDGHLISQVRNAKAKLLSEPWMLYAGEKPNEELSKAFRKRWFNKLIEYILEAELHGYSVVELTLKDKNVIKYELLDREFISIEKQWILIEGSIYGSYIPYADIMWDIDLLEFGEPKSKGILLECAYNILWKYYARSDWSRASEKFGMPILAIEADTTSDVELDDMERKAANFGTDGYIVTQSGDKVSIIERAGQKIHDIYLDNAKFCNEEVSKIVNGQTATSDQKAFVGAAEVQERVMDDFNFWRMQNIVDEMNEKTIPYLVAKGLLPEGITFDYPSVIRERERRIKGTAQNESQESEKEEDEQEETDPKNDK